MSLEDILYEVKGNVTVITLNLPTKLNALTGLQYLDLAKKIAEADEEENTVATIIQATGRYFSAGANVSDGTLAGTVGDPAELFSHDFWFKNFVGRNAYLVDLFHNHKKVLVAALNGPVIGLSSALVALCDIVYAIDDEKVFLLAPFANLGLVAEGAASSTLFLRLGWSKSAEALLFSKPIPGKDLDKLGFFNKTYSGEKLTTEEFNAKVLNEVKAKLEGLYEPSIFANKQLLKANRDQLINSASSKELIIGFNRWIQGIPQQRFVQIANKEIKHKM
ncbi:CIC11C00000000084 [Sungouiella intermedia]|uniref:CIC11C00000000084 n=1 Tax=Sungouiella intermedia TaxID=45354 RepID=A0A1L0DLR7_9ASCO|nr:CIC11C00000000084 [[Candida] intermedia]SGZ58437.1 CIC11C00000005106 [[Candida] intermedia]